MKLADKINNKPRETDGNVGYAFRLALAKLIFGEKR